jgi:nitrate/TMAO reductase-like tetraheme cytochrome c subunit
MEKATVEIERFKEAAQLDKPVVQWTKVHNLPDFVYFNHSRHVLSGITCVNCHGEIEKMTRVEQTKPLTMGWCLQCHRDHAGIPTNTLERAVKRFSETPKPPTGTDCASCHY